MTLNTLIGLYVEEGADAAILTQAVIVSVAFFTVEAVVNACALVAVGGAVEAPAVAEVFG